MDCASRVSSDPLKFLPHEISFAFFPLLIQSAVNFLFDGFGVLRKIRIGRGSHFPWFCVSLKFFWSFFLIFSIRAHFSFWSGGCSGELLFDGFFCT